MVQLVTDELRGEEAGSEAFTAPSRAQNAVRTATVMDAALASYYGGREDQFWRTPETWPGRQAAS